MTCGPCERGLKITRGPRLGTRTEPGRRAGTPARGVAGSDIPPGLPTSCQCRTPAGVGDPDVGLPVPCFFTVTAWSGVAGETLALLYPSGGGVVGLIPAGGNKYHSGVAEYRAEFPGGVFPNVRHTTGENTPRVWAPRPCDSSDPIGWTLARYTFTLRPVVVAGVITEWQFDVKATSGNELYEIDGGPFVARYSLAGYDPYGSRASGVLTLDTVDAGFSTLRDAYDTNPAGASAPSLPASITVRPTCFDPGCWIQNTPGVISADNLNPCYYPTILDGPTDNDPGPTVWPTPFEAPDPVPVCYWSWIDYDHWENTSSNCGDFENATCGPPPVCDGPPSGFVFPVNVGCFSTRGA